MFWVSNQGDIKVNKVTNKSVFNEGINYIIVNINHLSQKRQRVSPFGYKSKSYLDYKPSMSDIITGIVTTKNR